MNLVNVTDNSFDAQVAKCDIPVLALFSAKWSKPSQTVAGYLSGIAADYAGRVKVVELDIDDNPTIVSRYRILQAPTLLLFKNGLEVARLTGPAAPDRIEEMIAPFLKR
ncbi:MAG: thiol reductase thioredoxin [Chloroflexi bacterium]|nr:MAG: thiol reductase thioredoxin [Chloroflexota bacterium]